MNHSFSATLSMTLKDSNCHCERSEAISRCHLMERTQAEGASRVGAVTNRTNEASTSRDVGLTIHVSPLVWSRYA